MTFRFKKKVIPLSYEILGSELRYIYRVSTTPSSVFFPHHPNAQAVTKTKRTTFVLADTKQFLFTMIFILLNEGGFDFSYRVSLKAKFDKKLIM